MMETDSVLDEEGAVKDEGHRDGTNGVRHQEQQQRAHALPFQGMVDTGQSVQAHSPFPIPHPLDLLDSIS